TAIVLITPLNEPLLRKPYAGNPHVRFDEEEGSAHNRPSLLYRPPPELPFFPWYGECNSSG
ncbi:MAG: hypothetical protein AB7O38_11825, partial [Pirellulaceae bacterium]